MIHVLSVEGKSLFLGNWKEHIPNQHYLQKNRYEVNFAIYSCLSTIPWASVLFVNNFFLFTVSRLKAYIVFIPRFPLKAVPKGVSGNSTKLDFTGSLYTWVHTRWTIWAYTVPGTLLLLRQRTWSRISWNTIGYYWRETQMPHGRRLVFCWNSCLLWLVESSVSMSIYGPCIHRVIKIRVKVTITFYSVVLLVPLFTTENDRWHPTSLTTLVG